MKAVLQRVTRAAVSVSGEIIGRIGPGLVVLVGVANGDTLQDIEYLAEEIAGLRIFEDTAGKFNLSCQDIRGEFLIISQFTLLANSRKGRRPSFTEAAAPELAADLFNRFVDKVRESGLKVETGRFQADMLVEIHNDGPVTIILDSRDRLLPRS
jgi:D-aminoacyl-tRNA deacylase